MFKAWRQRWRLMRVFARQWPLTPARLPEWTDEDARAWKHWLEKPTGQKLILLIRHQEQATNAGAVMKQHRVEYACGFAAGFRACAAWMHTLAALTPPEASEPTQLTPRGAEELAETYAP